MDRLKRLENVIIDNPPELVAATAHREEGRYKEAEVVLRTWLISNPQDASAYSLLAQVLFLDKQDEPAWEAINRALAINPALPAVQRNHARLLLKQQRTADAFQSAQAAYQRDPSDPENQLVLAAILGANKQTEAAFQLVNNLLQNHPNCAEAFANRAMIKLRCNDRVGALADAEKALSIKPHLIPLWSTVSALRFQLKNLPGAIAALEISLTHEPTNTQHLITLGEFKRQAGEIGAAIVALEKAVTIAPDNAGAWVNLGTALQDFGRIPEAKAAYAKALAISPDQAEVAFNLGTLAKGEKNLVEALRCFNLALKIKPNFAEAHNNRGTILKDLGRLDEAEISYRRALQIRPDISEALFNLGNTLCDMDDLRQAAITYEKVLDLDPANHGLHAAVQLAVLHYLDGHLGECQSKLLASQPILEKNGPEYRNSRVYWSLLDKLQSCRRQSSEEKNISNEMAALHVIGESHSLSTHGVVVSYKQQKKRCVAEWIQGCKQWHLGNDKVNRFRTKFESVLLRLPRHSTVLFFIGEIDCRPDGGINKAWRKCPDSTLAAVMQSTVDTYVNYVAALAFSYGHTIIVGGVPSPTISSLILPEVEAEQHVHLVQIFNARLKSQALSAGADFLDVYALTDRGDGIASGEWHIDDIHLLPSAIVEAFDNYCNHP
jgi:tetratricopeptide (TPR) repeat protein